MNQHQILAVRALESARGDDSARARAAFRGYSTEQMKQQHGQSGKTRSEILQQYEDSDAEVNAAIAWVKAQA